MRSHLVAFLIAGLMLMPIVRATPAGMPSQAIEAACASCVLPMPAAAPETSDNCCDPVESEATDEPEEDDPCRRCPPLCCVLAAASVLTAPDAAGIHFCVIPRDATERPRDEHADSRALAPDPPVPIT